jgi:sulfatase-like protein
VTFPPFGWRFAHLAALWGYGVSQPVFSMLGGNPEFLVVRGSTRADVVVFAVLLAFAPPLVVVAFEAGLALLSRSVAGAVHVIAVWSFSFLAVLQLMRFLDPQESAALLLPLIPAALVAVAYLRFPAVRSFLTLSLALPVIALVSFVATVPLAVDDAEAADVRVATNTPVVLVVFDEFPVSSLMRADGSLDAVRYPNFARLAQDATWYPRATTVHDSTTIAVPAILTGQRPKAGSLPTLGDHPDNLFTLLGKRYTISASEQATRLCPSRYCPRTREVPVVDRQRGLFYDVTVGYLHRVLPASLSAGMPPIGERWGGFGESSHVDTRELVLGALDTNAWIQAVVRAKGRTREQFAEFLGSVRRPRAGERALFFEHALVPHGPSRFLPSGREYRSVDNPDALRENLQRWLPSPLLVEQALQHHLLQVGYADTLVGTLVRRLKAVGLYDRALVVVVADHGISFEPGGSARVVTKENVSDIAGVPLFVKYPGQHHGSVDRRAAETIDVVPTIADVIGVRIPWHVDGRSLRAAPVERAVTVSSGYGPVSASPAAVASGALATARRNASLFGQGHDSLYRIGPHTELLGRRVAAPRGAAADRDDVRLDDPGQFAEVRTRSLFVPALIEGDVEADAGPRGQALAIAVDGRIAATSATYAEGDHNHFTALVPEGAFHDGANSVDVYGLWDVAGAVRLTRLGGTPSGRTATQRVRQELQSDSTTEQEVTAR